MARPLYLDTSSLMYRAFFSVPDSIVDTEKKPVNALYGYLQMMAQLLRSRRPDETITVYDDDWRPAGRVAAFAGYKGTRPKVPDPLAGQFDQLPEILDALGMPQAWAKGWEAEDAIGTLAARADAKDRVEIVTGDRDLIQLVRDPVVRLLFTRKGVTDLHEMDEGEVVAKYGIPPHRYADFAILRGDPSDELPGVRGVGEKTALQLVLAYPSIDAMVEAAGTVRAAPVLARSPALKARLRDAADYLEAMKIVVPIRTDLDVEIRRPELDEAALAKIAERTNLSGPITRLREALA